MGADNELARHRELMRRSWEGHAKENAMFFINTLGKGENDAFQWNEEAFYASGADVLQFVNSYFPDSGLEDKVLLEIGCGIGRQTVHLAKLFRHVVATDISSTMLETARSKLAVENVTWVLISGADLEPVASESCDVVYSFVVFQHITDIRITTALIREAARVMKPEAWFIFQVRDLADNRSVDSVWQMTDLSAQQIRQICSTCGLEVESIDGEGSHYLWAVCSKS